MRVIFSAGHHSSGELALHLDAASHPRIFVRVRDRPIAAILDTGASRSVVDVRLARELGLQTRPGFAMAGLTSNVVAELAAVPDVNIGEMTLSSLTAGVVNLAALSPPIGTPTGMVLGRELFSETLVDLDFPKQRVTFIEIGSEAPKVSFASVPLRETAGGTPHIPIAIGGYAPIEAGFDLGYNAALLLDPAYADAGVLAGLKTSTVSSIGVEGVTISRVSALKSITLGGITLADVPVEVPPKWNRSIPAFVGLDIISRFHVVTDYPARRLWIAAAPELNRAPIPRDRSGIGAIPIAGGLEVFHVAQGSPAESAGLKRGDRIVQINRERVDAHYVLTHPRMGARPSGTAFDLLLGDGRQVRLILQDCY